MKFFRGLSRTATVMLLAVAGVCLTLLILGLLGIFFVFAFEKPLPFALGLLIGCVHSLLKVVLLERSIKQSVDLDGKYAQSYMQLQVLGRYGLTVAAVIPAMLFPKVVGVFGVICGVLSLQVAAYITNAVLKDKDV